MPSSPLPNAGAFRSGEFVAEHVALGDPEAQIQPNGVDLTAYKLLEPRGTGRIETDDKEIASRRELPKKHDSDRAYWRLGAEDYEAVVVQYGEQIHVPEGHVGFVLPRSSLIRNGVTIETAVWDAGYEGYGEGMLLVGNDLEIESTSRIAQFVLARADHAETYDGDYQGEAKDGGEDGGE